MPRWKTLKSETVMRNGFIKIRADECELPDGRVMPCYFVLEFPDWVNVVPLTSDGKIVLIRQHRHGVEEDFLEIPGGSTHGHGEDPRQAAERELLEETGFSSENWIYAGFHYPNPALQNNKMHTYVALDCVKSAEPKLDPYEDLVTVIDDWAEIARRYHAGEFTHSLIAASIGLSLKTLREKGIKTF